MTVIEERGEWEIGTSRVHWGAVFAGALAATALALVLHSFAGAVGLAVSSTAPTWRDASIALWILSGIYLILVALASYGLGGYITGWILSWSGADRGRSAEASEHLHGLIVWAIATIFGALLVGAIALGASRLAAPTAGTTGAATSTASESLIAYDLDRLLRSDGRAAPQGDYNRVRAEAGRILLTASGHTGIIADDRQYLIRLVTAQAGLAPPDAERRVDTAVARVRENIGRARKSTVILAFMAGAAILLGAVAAWYATDVGARHARDPRERAIWGERRAGLPPHPST